MEMDQCCMEIPEAMGGWYMSLLIQLVKKSIYRENTSNWSTPSLKSVS